MLLDQIWSYPVKSMLGGRVSGTMLANNGITGDRMFALRDDERDAIASGRRIAGLVKLAAVMRDDGSAEITLPNGSTIATNEPDVDRRLSDAVAHPVSLWVKQPASNADFYRRGRPDHDDLLTELRSIFGRDEDEPLPDFAVFPPELMEFEYPPGHFFDAYPLMIMTTSAVRSLAAAVPGVGIDERRFRPSLVIDTGDATGHPEFEWVGRRLRIGAAEVQILSGCPRCVMITRDFGDGLEADRSVLRHVVRDLDQNVGVYANIVTPGLITTGDSVELL